MRSTLAVYDLSAGRAGVILRSEVLIESPNWLPDGSGLLVNAEGRLWRVPFDAPALVAVPTGIDLQCNNDHGFSPCGQWLVFSGHRGRGAEMFRMPAAGGKAQALTDMAPSWFHGFSPDGGRIVYAAARGGRVVDIYAMPVDGGDEVRLTSGQGHSDGPEYGPDGWVYYNSDRAGHAQIWRARGDGTGHEQVFADDRVNWFPHPSPDGAFMLYLSYPPGTVGHPRDMPVEVWLMDMATAKRRRVLAFIGGQGTMNAPCWARDGRAFAFVRYEKN